MVYLNNNRSEFIGAMIGDGCISKYRSNDRIVKEVLLTGHSENDEEYYYDVIRPIIKEEFGVKGYIYERNDSNCLRFIMSSNIFDFLKDIGFPVGKKHDDLSIPNEVLNEDLFIPCIRGIFDTDGSIYQRYSKKYENHPKKYDYLNVQIKLKSKKVIEQIKELLEDININCNKIIRESNAFVLRITSQEDIDDFFERVSPNNPYHIERYLSRCGG